MFRKLYNRALIEAEIEPDGPVLVVEGGLPLDPMAPALAFVRTIHAGEPTVYLPGSSLKGVVRAHAERLLATEIGEAAAEDPFDDGPRRERAKAARRSDQPDRPAVYRASCEADRLFGSTEVAGRFRIADALPTPETLATANRTEIRFSVAIDRAKQSVRHGPFDQEAVTGGRFRLRATLENYELWMLALLLQVLRDLDDGFVQIGHAKTRGFGTVRVRDPRLRLLWPGERPASLQGAGARENSEETRKEYGLVPNDDVPLPEDCEDDGSGLLSGFQIAGWDRLHPLADRLGEGPWREYANRLRQEKSNGQ